MLVSSYTSDKELGISTEIFFSEKLVVQNKAILLYESMHCQTNA